MLKPDLEQVGVMQTVAWPCDLGL